MKGRIFEIKKFAVHDGDGIRTTVFLKGCPLRCKWCHNPEGLTGAPILSYAPQKCISCGECVAVCPTGAHVVNESGHTYSREKCIGCGKCEEVCLGEALKLYGKEVEAKDLLPELLEDRAFYENSGGGVTLSGGEPLLQADFAKELLSLLKNEGISTAVDTSGLVPFSAFEKVVPYTDDFLYDIKAIDEDTHLFCTGVSNRLILENIKRLDEAGKNIEVRYPFVPDHNDGEVEKIGAFLSGIKNLKKVRVLPYHAYAKSKYSYLGEEYPMGDKRMPEPSEVERAREILRKFLNCPVEE